MTIRWRSRAVEDLTRIRDYIADFNPAAAQSVVERILRAVERLETFPESGRPGQVPATREVVVPGLPYIVVYLESGAEVEIIAVFHGARDRR